MNKRFVSWECPNCGHENMTSHDVEKHTEMKIVYCDEDSGGCGIASAIQTSLTVYVDQIFRLNPVEATK